MHTIAVINSGSSTIKCALFDFDKITFTPIWKGIFDFGDSSEKEKKGKDFLKKIFQKYPDIKVVGHRIVHGGEIFFKPTLLNKINLKKLKTLSPLAPLHNPINIKGVEWAQALLPEVPQVAVFDTAFHHTIDKEHYTYPIPLSFLKQGIRRYGFHGINHQACIERLNKMHALKKRVVSCHLGNGCSLAAILKGKSIDTTMGLTPLEGLVMGTRSGSIDPGIIFDLIRREGYTPNEVEDILFKQSGLKALGGTHDMRLLLNKNKKLAIDIFCLACAKYIVAMGVSLGGIDTILFTGGIGENAFQIRDKICSLLPFLGVKLDKQKNQKVKEGLISSKTSLIDVFVIKACEEWLIAHQARNLIASKGNI